MGSSELAIGIIISFVATTTANYGMNLQKYSFFAQEQNPDAPGAGTKQRRMWICGFSFFVVGQIGILVSLGFIDQATAAIFSNVALISNAAFARYFFAEQLTKRDIIAMTLILGGSFLVVVYFVHVEQDFTADMIKEFLAEPLFLGFMGLQVLAFGICAFYARMRWKELLDRPSLAGLLFASMSALVGCCSLTFGKMFIAMLKESMKGDNQFTNGTVWFVTIIFICCALSNVYLLNLGLANAPAMVMIPIYYVLNTLLATAAGILCFQDFATFEKVLPSLAFLVGAMGSMVGVVVLSQKEAAGEDAGSFRKKKAADETDVEAFGSTLRIGDEAPSAKELEDADAASTTGPSAAKKRWNLLKSVRSVVTAVKMVTVHEGYLLKQSSGKVKRWQRRYFRVYGAHLQYLLKMGGEAEEAATAVDKAAYVGVVVQWKAVVDLRDVASWKCVNNTKLVLIAGKGKFTRTIVIDAGNEPNAKKWLAVMQRVKAVYTGEAIPSPPSQPEEEQDGAHLESFARLKQAQQAPPMSLVDVAKTSGEMSLVDVAKTSGDGEHGGWKGQRWCADGCADAPIYGRQLNTEKLGYSPGVRSRTLSANVKGRSSGREGSSGSAGSPDGWTPPSPFEGKTRRLNGPGPGAAHLGPPLGQAAPLSPGGLQLKVKVAALLQKQQQEQQKLEPLSPGGRYQHTCPHCTT
jgi:hypothetical protein